MVTGSENQENTEQKGALDKLGLGVEIQDGAADAPSSEQPQEFDNWAEPFYLRYKLATGFGVMLSAGWLWLSAEYISTYVGWDVLFELLPHEIGGLAAGILTPLALLWMVIALFERGHSLRSETGQLRWQIRQLTYPTDRSESRVKEITDSLRKQAKDLTKASDEAYQRAEAITTQVRERTLEL